MACYMMLGKDLQGVDANSKYYSAQALKCFHLILSDQEVHLATKMLAYARASTLNEISVNQRLEYKLKVVDLLSDIHDEPVKIACLAQEWKTYVRLARMVFAWKFMFFGLSRDTSRDLKMKSYLYFLRHFYKS